MHWREDWGSRMEQILISRWLNNAYATIATDVIKNQQSQIWISYLLTIDAVIIPFNQCNH